MTTVAETELCVQNIVTTIEMEVVLGRAKGNFPLESVIPAGCFTKLLDNRYPFWHEFAKFNLSFGQLDVLENSLACLLLCNLALEFFSLLLLGLFFLPTYVLFIDSICCR